MFKKLGGVWVPLLPCYILIKMSVFEKNYKTHKEVENYGSFQEQGAVNSHASKDTQAYKLDKGFKSPLLSKF